LRSSVIAASGDDGSVIAAAIAVDGRVRDGGEAERIGSRASASAAELGGQCRARGATIDSRVRVAGPVKADRRAAATLEQAALNVDSAAFRRRQ
jgi:hypothetical protein